MKSKNLFHLAIVFFMVVAIILLGGYEYSYSDLAPSQSTYSLLTDIWYPPSPYQWYPLWNPIGDIWHHMIPSVPTVPAVSLFSTPYNTFRNWRLDSSQYAPQIQVQSPGHPYTSFYNIPDSTITGVSYDIMWSNLPVTSNWNVYMQTDLYALPASHKYNLFQFTKGFPVPMMQPDIWVGYGGYGR